MRPKFEIHDVLVIRALSNCGFSARSIRDAAYEYVTVRAVEDVVTGHSWKFVRDSGTGPNLLSPAAAGRLRLRRRPLTVEEQQALRKFQERLLRYYAQTGPDDPSTLAPIQAWSNRIDQCEPSLTQ